MDKYRRKYRLWFIAGAAVIALLLAFLYYQHGTAQKQAAAVRAESYFKQEKTASGAQSAASSETKQEAKIIVVDMKGAVRKPGIYRMKPGDRVSDAINRAGGLTEKADKGQVNLARKLSDEMAVYIPEKGERADHASLFTEPTQPESGGDSGTSVTVHVNTAGEEELQNLPGIGPAKAKAIIQYREENGPFRSVDDLKKVSGIGDKSLEKIRPAATVD